MDIIRAIEQQQIKQDVPCAYYFTAMFVICQ